MTEQSTVRTSYVVPNTEAVADMTPDQAGAAIKETMAAASQDPKHPYSASGHSLHKDYGAFVAALFAKKSEAPGAAMDPAERVMDEALKSQQDRAEVTRETLSTAVKMQLARLEKLGFDTSEIDVDNVQPHQVKIWQMQGLAEQQDFATLSPLIEAELAATRQAPGVVDLFRQFNGMAGLDADLKKGVVEQVIGFIHKATEARQGKVR